MQTSAPTQPETAGPTGMFARAGDSGVAVVRPVTMVGYGGGLAQVLLHSWAVLFMASGFEQPPNDSKGGGGNVTMASCLPLVGKGRGDAYIEAQTMTIDGQMVLNLLVRWYLNLGRPSNPLRYLAHTHLPHL